MDEETKKEIGKWFMDIAKYVATATLISTFLGEFSQKWILYCLGITLVSTFFLLGVHILNKQKK